MISGIYSAFDSASVAVQIYNSVTREWMLGPNLPQEREGAALVQTADSFLVISGRNENSILEFDPTGEMGWIEREERLGAAKYGHYVMAVNEDVFCD